MPTLVEIGPSNASQDAAQKKGSNEIVEKIDTRQESNPGPCVSAQVRYRYATGAGYAYPGFLSYMSFHLLKLTSLPFPFLWTYTRHAILVYLNNLLCQLLISLYSKAILINYMPTLNQRSC